MGEMVCKLRLHQAIENGAGTYTTNTICGSFTTANFHCCIFIILAYIFNAPILSW